MLQKCINRISRRKAFARAVCDKKKSALARARAYTPIADATTASVMATKLYSPFFSARRRASAIIRLVGTLRSGLIELTIRQWHAEKREAHRGVVVRQSVSRPVSHAYGAFHYIKPFQCIIYFCVSHLRYGLCTEDRGPSLCNIADLKIAPPAESIARARARVSPFPSLPGIHYPHVRFFTEVLLPSHLYCDKPILHSVPSVVVRARAHTFSLSLLSL